MVKYVRVNGQRVTPAVARAVARMSSALQRRFDEELLVSSGRRTFGDQKRIFLERYRPQLRGNGPFGDVRIWRGVRYVRVKQGGTVAQPGTSRHESDRAVDVRDSGRDAGVITRGTPRSNWLRKNAPRFGFTPVGFSFGEPWHLDFTGNPHAGVPRKARPRPTPFEAGDVPSAPRPRKKKVAVVSFTAVKIPDAVAKRPPIVSVDNLGMIGDVRGLQKIARIYGAETAIDNEWGTESRKGFRRFLRANYGGSVVRWLRVRWGYNGNDRLGPVMIAALLNASEANRRAL